MQDGTSIGILVALFAGLLSFLSPCVLPLVPSYVSFVTGLGLEELEQGGGEVKRVTLVHSLLFVAGFTLIFLLSGHHRTRRWRHHHTLRDPAAGGGSDTGAEPREALPVPE